MMGLVPFRFIRSLESLCTAKLAKSNPKHVLDSKIWAFTLGYFLEEAKKNKDNKLVAENPPLIEPLSHF